MAMTIPRNGMAKMQTWVRTPRPTTILLRKKMTKPKTPVQLARLMTTWREKTPIQMMAQTQPKVSEQTLPNNILRRRK